MRVEDVAAGTFKMVLGVIIGLIGGLAVASLAMFILLMLWAIIVR